MKPEATLDINEKKIVEKLGELGLEPDISIIHNSLVSTVSADRDKMFEEFLKLVIEYNSNENVYKFGKLPSDGRKVYPMALLGTVSEKAAIVKAAAELHVKPRYTFAASFFKNYNIGLSAVESKDGGNKATLVAEIISSFVNFKSLLMYKEAGRMNPEEAENEPSEKLKRGILGG